ncbi:hypothetical protein LS68_006315 [Helicobacter sp. MIT 05-5293]|uniref:YqiA/YcfP family alpha/beta fold hydrolase n=1 Tax=Helicobacter sp. MIT 05-5293 TaxID=1548149 RepID=UPI00051D665A|nr:YqiA/YcfP family alpha/beta fold hydrolase [Helicobacter sp. MIT 05-5293]TLD81073.1 hypothetical protein LS68_006315 [Helicobacter sp. MIT 05-5293]
MEYFYSYGFHSSIKCETYQKLCAGLRLNPIELSYDNGGDFQTNLTRLCNQLTTYINERKISSFGFIGNSLGAFYLSQLTFLANDSKDSIPLPKKLIMFNPVVTPLTQLRKYADKIQINTTTSESFAFPLCSLESYKEARLPSAQLTQNTECFVCLGINDELIDINDTQRYWHNYARIITFEGGHKVKDFAPFREII